MAVIKIKSTHVESQGDFVLIEEEAFDPAKGHEMFVPAASDAPEGNAPKPRGRPAKASE